MHVDTVHSSRKEAYLRRRLMKGWIMKKRWRTPSGDMYTWAEGKGGHISFSGWSANSPGDLTVPLMPVPDMLARVWHRCICVQGTHQLQPT